MAEFETADALLAAAHKTREAGYSRMDAYSPFPVEGLSEAVGFHKTHLPLIVLISGLLGGAGGFSLQYWVHVIAFPLNIGGKPYNSWPAFVPITFEMAVLGAALACVFGMLALNGLPRLHHPVFNLDRFQLASRDRFFLCIEADDPKFNLEETKQFMSRLHASEVSAVEL